jgi:uncharacterized membrane protein YdbT with pleckstrin-like domain
MENGSLRREVIAWDQSGITKIAYVLLAIAVPSIYFTRGTPLYLTCVLFMLSSIVGVRVYAGTGVDMPGMNLGTYTSCQAPGTCDSQFFRP